MPPYLSQLISSYVCHQMAIQIVDAFSELLVQRAYKTNVNQSVIQHRPRTGSFVQCQEKLRTTKYQNEITVYQDIHHYL